MAYPYSDLRAAIDAEPANAPPATDEAVRAWCVADIPRRKRAGLAEIYRALMDAGTDDELEDALIDLTFTAVEKKIATKLFRLFGQQQIEDIDVNHARFTAAMDVLVSSPRFSSFGAPLKAEILALGTETVPRYMTFPRADGAVGVPSPLVRHITRARAL